MILNILLGIGIGLLGSHVISDKPFTVALDCKTNTVSWTGAPSNTGNIVLFAKSKTQRSTQVVSNIPATRNMITVDDTLQEVVSSGSSISSDGECSPMFAYYGKKRCPGDLEITAFAIQDPRLEIIKRNITGRGYTEFSFISSAEIRDLAASKALASTSVTVQCLQNI